MKLFNTRKYPILVQYLISLFVVLVVSILCFSFKEVIGYREIALILLMMVSFIAMLFEILPVLISAVFSAIIWNYFFIPPIYTFHINNAEDVLMFLVYLFIALLNAVLTFKIREAENNARDEKEKEKTIKLYNTLLNSLSHELRTPIATILVAVDTLKENKDKLSEYDQAELLLEIDKASIRLNRQVENLLNMSRLESGMLKPKLDWSDVKELIITTIRKLTSNQNDRINFQYEDNIPLFKIDEGLLEQIITNLLYNAMLYTDPINEIRILLSYEKNKLILVVSDNGPGFPKAEISKAFDKFHRVPGSKTGGSGIGLSIVKGFVEAMQGTIKLENQRFGGAKFHIEIPAETSFLNSQKNE